jgi:hypothetical protein
MLGGSEENVECGDVWVACNEFARVVVSEDGEGKLSVGAGREWNSFTAMDSDSS